MRPKLDVTKHTLHLRSGDWQALAEMFPDVSTSLIIRSIVAKHVDLEREKRVANLAISDINVR